MNKNILRNLTVSGNLFNSVRSGAILTFLHLGVVFTLCGFCLAQQSKSVNQSSESNLLARQAKPKSGLIRVQNNLVYGENNSDFQVGKAALVFDDIYAYLATPNGLYRTAQPITANSSIELIGFQNKSLLNLYDHNNALYVLKHFKATLGRATNHSFLKSEDRGATFIPMDGALHSDLAKRIVRISLDKKSYRLDQMRLWD
jgi:hypothetical protein